MIKYWPSRNNPKGFSIKSLARNHQKKLSTHGLNNSTDNKRVCSSLNYALEISRENKNHWANRSFEEYKKLG